MLLTVYIITTQQSTVAVPFGSTTTSPSGLPAITCGGVKCSNGIACDASQKCVCAMGYTGNACDTGYYVILCINLDPATLAQYFEMM